MIVSKVPPVLSLAGFAANESGFKAIEIDCLKSAIAHIVRKLQKQPNTLTACGSAVVFNDTGGLTKIPYFMENVMKTTQTNSLTLADHAELWWDEQGHNVPERDTQEWQTMYSEWIEFAFAT